MIPGLHSSGLDLELVVSPKQAQLPGLYKGHDVFLFTSRCGEGRGSLLVLVWCWCGVRLGVCFGRLAASLL